MKPIDTVTENPYYSLNDVQKKDIVDVYVNGGSIAELKTSDIIRNHDGGKFVCTSMAKDAITSLDLIKSDILSMITDTDGLADLKTKMLEKHTSCTQVAIEYTIDQMLLKLTLKGEGTYESLKTFISEKQDATI